MAKVSCRWFDLQTVLSGVISWATLRLTTKRICPPKAENLENCMWSRTSKSIKFARQLQRAQLKLSTHGMSLESLTLVEIDLESDSS